MNAQKPKQIIRLCTTPIHLIFSFISRVVYEIKKKYSADKILLKLFENFYDLDIWMPGYTDSKVVECFYFSSSAHYT